MVEVLSLLPLLPTPSAYALALGCFAAGLALGLWARRREVKSERALARLWHDQARAARDVLRRERKARWPGSRRMGR